MHQSSFELSVSRRTGESLQTIRQRGFSLVRMPEVQLTSASGPAPAEQPPRSRGRGNGISGDFHSLSEF